MLVELVQTTTRDGLRLDGIFQKPDATLATDPGADGYCFLHGTGSNFYGSTLLDALAADFLRRGIAVLRVNTRGHDGISTAATASGGRRLGAAYEVVDDCRHDVAAWCDWLAARVGPRVGLLGHSMGAVKCLYALAQEPRPTAGVVAVSPPRLSYSWFCHGGKADLFRATYAAAESLVEAGTPAALLEVGFPLSMVIAAGGYLEKYGPDERYNYLRFLGSVPGDILVTLGAVEMQGNPAFQGADEAMGPIAAKRPGLTVATVEGADHFYTGVRERLVERVGAWLDARASGEERR